MSYQNPLEALEKFQTIKPNPGKPQTTRPVIQALMYRENTWESIFTSNMMYLYTGPAITLRLVEKTTKDIADENEQNTRGELVAKEETDYDKEQGMGNAHDTKDNHNVEGESGEEQQGLVTDSGASGYIITRLLELAALAAHWQFDGVIDEGIALEIKALAIKHNQFPREYEDHLIESGTYLPPNSQFFTEAHVRSVAALPHTSEIANIFIEAGVKSSLRQFQGDVFLEEISAFPHFD
ncbi:hypothetical protein BJ875DRAFT_529470 [Amylocarpus encephaloides]|uniref:Uncharacterized protein n=1 Tax=Amylocarpus encephaloides TaxID=45428 RepID=A0A9P7YKS9_9HELO|nr:hypothetical protein BJ875DRAFT_529470 [Amylocarpus encephaloides]